MSKEGAIGFSEIPKQWQGIAIAAKIPRDFSRQLGFVRQHIPKNQSQFAPILRGR
jgi:hypothetical protein